MLEQLLALDAEALLWLNSFHTPLLDRFMMIFTGRFTWVVMYASLLYVLLRTYGKRRTAIFVIGVALAIGLSDQIVASLLRPIFQRLRPANLDNPLSELVLIVDGYRGGRYGFPSCHGANSFALAVYMSMIVRRPRFIFFMIIWATLNCYTRNYLGVHYPGDILAGAAIGTVIATCCAAAAMKMSGVTVNEAWKISDTPLMPSGTGACRRLKVYDTTVITGLVTTSIILIIAIFRA